MKHLPHIAGLAESLGVLTNSRSSAHHWNYVIEDKVINSVTPATLRIFPVPPLPRREVSTVSKLLARKRFSAGQVSKHLVSVDAPSFLESGGDLGSGFRCVLITLWRSALSSGRIGSRVVGNLLQRFRAMRLSPKGIASTAHRSTLAFGLTARFGNSTLNVRGATIKGLAAKGAFQRLACFDSGHVIVC